MLGGVGAGLALSPLAGDGGGVPVLVVLATSVLGLLLTRPSGRAASLPWLALVVLAGAGVGLQIGVGRLRAIDAGAYVARSGTQVTVRGHVTTVPRRSRGRVRIRADSSAGRIAIEAPEPVPDLPIGAEVRAAGTVAAPPPWLEGDLRRHGIARLLRASRVELTGDRRGGLEGRIDRLRSRSEEALGRGMPDSEAALARGFVLGQDDRIAPSVVEDFQRSGLAHLLAVSGQNVVLLALLATPILAALGLPLRARLLWLLGLIALYVPLAGGGASIQRAGAMGAAGIVATLSGRPSSRLYALLLAVAATLALNPRASSDIGWQLSFAAVAGIFCLVAPIRGLLATWLGVSGPRRALVDGMAVTVAATLATAPLMAIHFEAVSVTSLAANVLALPAVAPAMWLGMLAAALGQLPAIPVEPLNWVNSLLLAYIGQLAEWMADPSWAQLPAPAVGATGVVAAYAALLACALALRGWTRGRRGLRVRSRSSAAAAAATVLAAVVILALPGLREAGGDPVPEAGLRITVLDVGQGDSILLQPGDGAALLVDGGPPGQDLPGKLSGLGVEALAAAVVSHDQLDHSGGIAELLGSLPVRRLVYAEAGRSLLAAGRAAGAMPTRVAEGSGLRSGSLRLDVLWPPRVLLKGAPPADPNARSLVLLARWRGFEMLLTGDAEAETVPIDPGPLDVLKVSHHGSADEGLESLLDRTAPRLAVISVGDDNPFGHPDPATIAALRAHGVQVLRTDRAGAVTIEAGEGGAEVDADR